MSLIQSDFLVPQLYGYGAEKTWPTVAWENKSDIFIWRGRLTGVHYLGSKLSYSYSIFVLKPDLMYVWPLPSSLFILPVPLSDPTLGGYWQQSTSILLLVGHSTGDLLILLSLIDSCLSGYTGQRVLLNAICRGQAGFFDLFWGNGTIVQQGTMLAKVFAKDYLE
jgi:hypothetical protein